MKKLFTILFLLLSVNCFANSKDTTEIIVIDRNLRLNVDSSIKQAKFTISNICGEIVGGGVFKANTSFPFNALPSGLYIVRLYADDKFYFEKFYKRY